MRNRILFFVVSTLLPLGYGCFQDLVSADGGSLQVVAGDRQLGVTGGVLPVALRIRVTDQDDLPVANRRVTFTVEEGNGSVSAATVTTDLNGEASTSWTLGSTVGEQRVRATADQLPSVTFIATANFTLFDIDLRFLSAPSASQRTAFEGAATRWRSVITGELSEVPVNAPAGQCGANSPTINETIDDVIIFVTLEQIDGSAGSLGQAGPCFIRTSNSLPLIGQMRLDIADLNALEQTGDLADVILHEMAHVLGVGTLWVEMNLLQDPAGLGGTDPHFTGPLTITAFDAVGGAGYAAGQKVPVENTGGSGTSDGHWRESVLHEELMTGFLNTQQPNPLSEITVASMQDLGYSVNQDAADPYLVTITSGFAAQSVQLQPLGADLYIGALYGVASHGETVRIR